MSNTRISVLEPALFVLRCSQWRTAFRNTQFQEPFGVGEALIGDYLIGDALSHSLHFSSHPCLGLAHSLFIAMTTTLTTLSAPDASPKSSDSKSPAAARPLRRRPSCCSSAANRDRILSMFAPVSAAARSPAVKTFAFQD